MCCFSRPVDRVADTRILARGLDDGRQVLVYAMDFAAAGDLAMVLPLPVPAGVAEDAVSFVDLSGYPTLFADLDKAFPPPPQPRGRSLGTRVLATPTTLKVHAVGAFEASFSPSRADLARLDARFRLSEAALDALPDAATAGFVVFRLKGDGRSQSVHPMAFRFPRRDRARLFFPTVHVHDGQVHDRARFDHALYAQSAGAPGPVHGAAWVPSEVPLARTVALDRAAGTLTGELPAWKLRLSGLLPNQDVRVAV